MHRVHLAGPGCQNQRGRRGKIFLWTQRKHTQKTETSLYLQNCTFICFPCVWAGHRFCQRLGAAERMQLFNSGDSSHGEDHSGQAALGPVHRNTSRLHSHSKSEFSRKTQTKHFVFCFLRRDLSGRSVSGWVGCTLSCLLSSGPVSPF